MKTNHLQQGFTFLALLGCLSCSHSIEPMHSINIPLKRANFVLQKDDDFYSSYAVLENETVLTDKRGMPLGVPLFEKSPTTISYLLNGQSTKDRIKVRAVFMNRQVNEVFLQEDQVKGQRLVMINYAE